MAFPAQPSIRPDIRLENSPMQPVTCGSCGASVTARKSSWDQTTVQWTTSALTSCWERAQTAPSDRPNRQAFEGCSAMRAAIRSAAVAGRLDVQSGEPLPTNPMNEEH